MATKIADEIVRGLTELADDLKAGRPVGRVTVLARGKLMATAVAANNMGRVPRKPRTAVMEAAEFRAILESAGLTTREAADKLGVGRGTVSRWQTGETPIAAGIAKLIRAVFPPKKKK